jgi:hypothetical protein
MPGSTGYLGHTEQRGSDLNGSDLNGSDLNGSDLNGSDLNGSDLNGSDLNGSDLNGSDLNGSDLNGSDLNGSMLQGVTLAGTLFRGIMLDGTAIEGKGFVGVTFVGRLSSGATLSLRVDGIEQGSGVNADVYYYTVSYPNRFGGWSPLCGYDGAGVPKKAIPLAGRWDYRQGVAGGGAKIADPGVFTFACQGGALAKCVDHFGYKPWQEAGGVSLEAYHQACTRLVRADYCGDGRSWTVNGRPINVYDSIGVQADTETWKFEAEWTPQGARCVSAQRVFTYTKTGLSVPTCLARLSQPSCGDPSSFASGTLLMNEFESVYVSAPFGVDLGQKRNPVAPQTHSGLFTAARPR